MQIATAGSPTATKQLQRLPAAEEAAQLKRDEEGYWEGTVHFLPKADRWASCNCEFGAIDYAYRPESIGVGGGVGVLLGTAVGNLAEFAVTGQNLGWAGATVGGLVGAGMAAWDCKHRGQALVTSQWGCG